MMEPEMISIDSCLYRKHPDYVLHTPGRPYTFGRGQLVLDLSREEVCDYVTLTGHVKMPLQWVMSENVWNRMSANQQEILVEAGVEAGLMNNEICLNSEEEYKHRSAEELSELKREVREKMLNAGAHFVLDNITELPACIEKINR